MIEISEYLISPTSQFYYCGMPFRLDSMSKCNYNCEYCFSRLRGGNHPKVNQFIEKDMLYKRIYNSKKGIVNELFMNNVPIHIGGMSDPFSNDDAIPLMEEILNTFQKLSYPIVISTKNPNAILEFNKDYSENSIIQVSFSTFNNSITNILEPEAPRPSDRIKAIKKLCKYGYRVTARIQPYFYSLKNELITIILPSLIEAGIDHLILEHLKMPIEKSSKRALIYSLKLCNIDIDLYEKYGIKCGRSILLPNEFKYQIISEVRNICKCNNISFGAGDYGFYHFSTTNCCCGTDKYFPNSNWFKGNFTNVIKNCTSRTLFITELDKYDYPTSSITRYINSHSRINNNQVKELLIDKWNKPGTPNSLDSYFGIHLDDNKDVFDNCIYIKEDTINDF